MSRLSRPGLRGALAALREASLDRLADDMEASLGMRVVWAMLAGRGR